MGNTIVISKEDLDALVDFLVEEKKLVVLDLDFADRSKRVHSQESSMIHYFTGREVELVKQYGILVEILKALRTLNPD